MRGRRTSTLRRYGQSVLSLLVLVTVAGLASERVARYRANDAYPVAGKLVRIDGDRRIQIDCRGTGSPTVVLESGLDILGSLSWVSVHDSIARTTRVCAYSRAGIMWSDPTSRTFDSRDVGRDLHTALLGAGEVTPFVVVGHSIGAAYAMRFAADYPTEVAGLVLVDPSHPDQFAEFEKVSGRSLLPSSGSVRVAGAVSWTGLLRLLPQQNPSSWPMQANAPSAAFLPTSLAAAASEADAIPRTLENARALEQFGGRPLVVLSAEDEHASSSLKQMGLTDAQGRRVQEVQHRLHHDLASMSRAGRHEYVQHSSHYIQFDRPDVVIRAVRTVVETLRARPHE